MDLGEGAPHREISGIVFVVFGAILVAHLVVAHLVRVRLGEVCGEIDLDLLAGECADPVMAEQIVIVSTTATTPSTVAAGGHERARGPL